MKNGGWRLVNRWTGYVNNISLFGLNTLCRQISEILTTFTFRFPGSFPNRIPFPFYNQLHNYIWRRGLLVEVFPPAEPQWRVEFIVKWRRQIHPCAAIKVIIMERYYFVKVMAAPRIMSLVVFHYQNSTPSIPLTIHPLSPTPPFFGLYISGDEILASEKRMSLICRQNHEVEVI